MSWILNLMRDGLTKLTNLGTIILEIIWEMKALVSLTTTFVYFNTIEAIIRKFLFGREILKKWENNSIQCWKILSFNKSKE